MNLFKIQLLSTCFLFISFLTYGASFPSIGYTSETNEEVVSNNESYLMLEAAYANYNASDPNNWVDLHGGAAPDPVLTNGGAAFAVGDSVQIDVDGGGYDWYVLNWSTTWSGFLTIFTTGGSPVETQVGGTDAAFLTPDVPISDEWYILAFLVSAYGIYIYRKKRKKLTI